MDTPFVSNALQIASGPLYEPLRQVVAAIDFVHKDGLLCAVPVLWSDTLASDGQYKASADGVPQEIAVSLTAEYPEWTFLHEIGHFLDHQAMDIVGKFASTESERLQDWREAIDRSEAISALQQSLLTGKITVAVPSVGLVPLSINQEYVRYQLQGHELFARSYAQWIAVESRNPMLLHQLQAIQSSGSGQKYRRQWNDVDFVPIGDALKTVWQ